jgi:tetratricopeptide (TPR) repeat protein
MKDFFSIQSEIANKIAVELKTELSSEELKKIEKRPTKNLEAYNLYLLGKFYINQNDEETLKEGIRCFKNAIQLDSTFALAYVGLSQCYQFMVRYSWMPRDEIYHEAKEAIIKAIKLDESLGEAHSTLGLIMIVFNWDIYGPEYEFQKAIQLSPGNSEVYSSYAQYLRWIGRYDEGIKIAKRAIELDPLTPITNMWLGAINLYACHYDESIEDLKKVLDLDSTYYYAYAHLAFNYTLKGLYSEAICYADKTFSLIGSIIKYPLIACNIGWVYAKSGEITKAKEILTQVEELYAQINGDPIHIAIIYSGLGEHEKAFEYLSKALKVRSGQIIYLNAFANVFFKDISSDPRYIDLLKKIGFKVN